MPSDSQLLAEILAELKTLNAAMKSQTVARQVSPGAPGGADPVIPFGRSKGKRMSEVGASEWEYFAKLPLREKKDGGFWPPDLQNAALAMLGRPPISATPAPVEDDDADDDADGATTQRYFAPPPRGAATHDPVDLDCPF